MTEDKLQKPATALLKIRAEIAAAEQKIKPLKEAADALEAELLTQMHKAKLESFGTEEATFAIKRTVFAELFDDAAFFEYVRKKKAFDLVRRQPIVAACRARWDENLEVPGVRPGTRIDLSITKRR